MKIYIHPLAIDDISALQTQFTDILRSTITYTEVYTTEGFYRVDSRNVYRLEPVDQPIAVHPSYHGQTTLIVDPSTFKRTLERAICGTEHCVQEIQKQYFRLNAKSKMSFVLEFMRRAEEWVVSDIYFESDDPVNVQELFVKQEIIEFLSLLN